MSHPDTFFRGTQNLDAEFSQRLPTFSWLLEIDNTFLYAFIRLFPNCNLLANIAESIVNGGSQAHKMFVAIHHVTAHYHPA